MASASSYADTLPSIKITEVDANGNSASYGADWFELTNTGNTAVNISGWRMDDNSNLFANSVALRGLTTLSAGQSAIFLEGNSTGSTDATIQANFIAAWFGSSVPANLTFGFYGGSGVGLSSSADAVNIFDASGTVLSRVDFGASTLTTGTFDNSTGFNNVTLTQRSLVGINGAFASVKNGEIGAPGVVSAVPEPEPIAMLLSGLGLIGMLARRRSI